MTRAIIRATIASVRGYFVKSYSSREVIKILKADSWTVQRIEGSHHHFVHKTKKGIVTVPHPQKDFPQKTLVSIFNQAGLDIK